MRCVAQCCAMPRCAALCCAVPSVHECPYRVSATNSGMSQRRGDHALAPEAVLAEVGISRWCGDHGDDGDDGDLLIGLPRRSGNHQSSSMRPRRMSDCPRRCEDHGRVRRGPEPATDCPRRRGGHGSENRTNREARMKVTWSYWAGIADMGGPGARRG